MVFKRSRKISIRVISMLMAVVLINSCFVGVEAEDSETLPDIVVYENLLNNRHWVIDTFTKDQLPESNPHAFVMGYGNQDYMYKDILDRYEEDLLLKDGVNTYYRIEHFGETVSELPTSLADILKTESDKTGFIKGAKDKNYDSVLNSMFSTDYTSQSGLSMSSDLADLQNLRTIKSFTSASKDLFNNENNIAGNVNLLDSEYKKLVFDKYLPGFVNNTDSYIQWIDEILNKAAYNTGKKKEKFDDLYEAYHYSLFKSEYTSDVDWMGNLNRSIISDNTVAFLEALELGVSFTDGMLGKALMLESLMG